MAHHTDIIAIAEAAWNGTKVDDDPRFADSHPDHQQKLTTACRADIETGKSGIQGLEAFDSKVLAILAAVRTSLEKEAVDAAAKGEEPLAVPQDVVVSKAAAASAAITGKEAAIAKKEAAKQALKEAEEAEKAAADAEKLEKREAAKADKK